MTALHKIRQMQSRHPKFERLIPHATGSSKTALFAEPVAVLLRRGQGRVCATLLPGAGPALRRVSPTARTRTGLWAAGLPGHSGLPGPSPHPRHRPVRGRQEQGNTGELPTPFVHFTAQNYRATRTPATWTPPCSPCSASPRCSTPCFTGPAPRRIFPGF